jgi:hypothetical protein
MAMLAFGLPRSASAELPPDCARPEPSPDPIPAWSRLQWSVGVGAASSRPYSKWDATFVVAPQAGFAVWAKEWRCVDYGKGGGFFMPPHVWIRWSLSVTGDLLWRPGPGEVTDYRPAVRVSWARMVSGLLSVGSLWVPTTELWLSAGPTFDSSSSGASLGLGARLTIFSFEVRGTAHTGARDHELVLLIGVTDLHGLLKLGPDRS